jgi:hypothetical protein
MGQNYMNNATVTDVKRRVKMRQKYADTQQMRDIQK